MKKYRSIKSRIELLKMELIIHLMLIKKIPYDEAVKQFNASTTNRLLSDITTQFYDLTKEELIAILNRETTMKEFLDEVIKTQNNKMVNYAQEKIKQELITKALSTNRTIEEVYHQYTHPKKKIRKK